MGSLATTLQCQPVLPACGSQSVVPVAHQPTTHTLTVTATSGALSHSTTLNLTVQ
jgi:hypothetical protein